MKYSEYVQMKNFSHQENFAIFKAPAFIRKFKLSKKLADRANSNFKVIKDNTLAVNSVDKKLKNIENVAGNKNYWKYDPNYKSSPEYLELLKKKDSHLKKIETANRRALTDIQRAGSLNKLGSKKLTNNYLNSVREMPKFAGTFAYA